MNIKLLKKKIKINLCKFDLANKFLTNRSINIHKKKISVIESKLKSKINCSKIVHN